MLKWSALVALLSLNFPSIIMGIPEELKELAQQLHGECVGQTGVDESFIVAANNKGGFADDDKFKCYIKCIFEELAIIDDNDEVDQDALLAVMPDDIKPKAEPMIRTCGTKKGSDLCDTIYQTSKCYYEVDPDIVNSCYLVVSLLVKL